MIFHARDKDISFSLCGIQYDVPAGFDVEIPDGLAFAVKSRGLALVEGAAPNSKGKAKPAAAPILARAPAADMVPSKKEAAEALADVTGEDPSIEDEDKEADEMAAKTAASLERQGIPLPGSKPKKRWGK